MRVKSVPALRLERFPKLQVHLHLLSLSPLSLATRATRSTQGRTCGRKTLDRDIRASGYAANNAVIQRICLRQNEISRIEFPSNVAVSLKELDLYDNLISHIKNLDEFHNLTTLDLSFNKIKHIKNVAHLVNLTDIFFVQNKISRIEGLEGLTQLRNLELGANRIRV